MVEQLIVSNEYKFQMKYIRFQNIIEKFIKKRTRDGSQMIIAHCELLLY